VSGRPGLQAGDCPNPYVHKLASGREVRIRCKRRTCSSCGVLWAGDSRVRLLANLIDGHGGDVAMVTVTAPGRDALPHDQEGVVDRAAAEAWNKAAPAQWSRLHRRCRYRLREAPCGPPALLGYVWAFQRRGVLHVHLAFAADTPARKAAARGYVQLLKAGLAAEWGFGFVDLQMAHHGAKGVGNYFAKYVCKEGAGGRPELAETVAHPDVPARPIYLSNRLTARTRCTMRNLRLRRYYWRAETMRQAGMAECWYVEELWQRGLRVEHGRLVRPARAP
jgi:hypothetical protein